MNENNLTEPQWSALGKLHAFWQMWGDNLALMNIGGANNDVFPQMPELVTLGLAEDCSVTPEQFDKMKTENQGDIAQGMLQLASALFAGKGVSQYRITKAGRDLWQQSDRQTWWDKFKNELSNYQRPEGKD